MAGGAERGAGAPVQCHMSNASCGKHSQETEAPPAAAGASIGRRRFGEPCNRPAPVPMCCQRPIVVLEVAMATGPCMGECEPCWAAGAGKQGWRALCIHRIGSKYSDSHPARGYTLHSERWSPASPLCCCPRPHRAQCDPGN